MTTPLLLRVSEAVRKGAARSGVCAVRRLVPQHRVACATLQIAAQLLVMHFCTFAFFLLPSSLPTAYCLLPTAFCLLLPRPLRQLHQITRTVMAPHRQPAAVRPIPHQVRPESDLPLIHRFPV